MADKRARIRPDCTHRHETGVLQPGDEFVPTEEEWAAFSDKFEEVPEPEAPKAPRKKPEASSGEGS